MIDIVLWLLVVEALGLAALPLAWWLLSRLPDRGLTLAKPLGLLLVGYAIWLTSSFGVLTNRRATIVLCILVLAALAWGLWGRAFWVWLRTAPRLWVAGEVVFLVGFLLVAALRAYNPAISGTEKPMDFAFLNASLRAETAPPQDPWLAGYGISYYYFGYYLMALLVNLSGVAPAVGFNLALAFLFGATAAGAYGLIYNLISGREENAEDRRGAHMNGRAAVFALLGPLFLLCLANLEGLLEVLRQLGALSPELARWLHIRDLSASPVGALWFPTDPPDTWWWWRATRVVGTFDPVTGAAADYTINEFPFFSFLLGDLHPHVMALPFVALALGLALSLLRESRQITADLLRAEKGRALLYVLCFGALGFLNTWDLPVFLGLLSLCYLAQRVLTTGRAPLALVVDAVLFGLGALALCVTAYWPFYLWLSTQASGIGLVATRTQWQHLAIFWGPLLLIALAYPLVAGAGWQAKPGARVWPWLAAGALFVGLILVGAASLAVLLTLAALAVWALGRGLSAVSGKPEARAEDAFALLLVLVAASLLAGCEVLFVRDSFGNRMNTVFKLYYQAWALLAAAAAYTLYYVGWRCRSAGWRGVRLAGYRAWMGLVALVLAGGLVYTAVAPYSKAGQFAGRPTLDGLAWLSLTNPDERAAIAWLQGLEGSPIILEASGAEYSGDNAASAFSGLPSVLGWAGHEYQWRGNTPVPARRKADVDAIYQTGDVNQAERLLRQYGVTYVYVGDAERRIYGSSSAGALSKFARFMDVAYHNDRVTIYRLPPAPR